MADPPQPCQACSVEPAYTERSTCLRCRGTGRAHGVTVSRRGGAVQLWVGAFGMQSYAGAISDIERLNPELVDLLVATLAEAPGVVTRVFARPGGDDS